MVGRVSMYGRDLLWLLVNKPRRSFVLAFVDWRPCMLHVIRAE